MAEIHLVVDENGIQTAWFDKDNADQQAYKTNKEIEALNTDLVAAGHEPIPLVKVITVAIQDSTVLPYITVYVEDGIIQKAVPRLKLDEAIAEMNEELYDNFDSETDDARIFNSQGVEVHSFDHEAMYAKLRAEDEADAGEEN